VRWPDIAGRSELSECGFYKVRIEAWFDSNPAESDLDDIARSMGVGEAVCTKLLPS
jgi:hypothetical protein